MAKKLGRPKKKRKYTKRNIQLDAMINEKSQEVKQEVKQEVSRANEKSYVLAPMGSKTFVRNLSDEALLQNKQNLNTLTWDLRNKLIAAEQLQWQISKEIEFREL